MIKSLQIGNYALIEHLEMRPAPQLNIITGETGAGKSIMLGAVGLLLGNRADTKVLFKEDEKCIIEGVFDVSAYDLKPIFTENDLDYYDDCIIRREISPAGKSRAFINDTPVNLDVMKIIGDYLVDVHSQRDTLLLGSPSYQLTIVDAYAGNEALLLDYQQNFRLYKQKLKAYNELNAQAVELKKEADYHQFLFDELNKANLQEEEQENLEAELQIVEHAEEIKTKLLEITSMLNDSELAVIEQLQSIRKTLEHLGGLSEHYMPYKNRVESCLYELKDIATELISEEQAVEFEPSKLETIQERLSEIFRLQQKHGVASVRELLTIHSDLEQKVNRVLNLDGELEQAQQALAKQEKVLTENGKKLTNTRKNALGPFKNQVESLLKGLGMPDATMAYQHREMQPAANGLDDIKILFSANKGISPDELKNVASGGEFSRLMFAVKYVLATKTFLPTIIFDEIDTGISGEIALKMVNMMQDMARKHQVIAITHLPQIAARGDRHFFVYKELNSVRAISKVRELSENEREQEIAKMIGGDNPSKVAIESARELLMKN